ncbi:MAG: Na+/H+ antiporter NhaA [Hyphomicrobiaceae bacterium]|nr:Na+/H+ antiporter NhaA [Hyphomicrobiaceae bacterium]
MQARIKGALGFIHHEAAAGIFLLIAAIFALGLENSPWRWLYDSLLDTRVTVGVGSLLLYKPLLLWINDGLMAIFFFLVGLEIKRELLVGELSSLRKAALPAFAAVGGMVVPAAIYLAFNFADPVARNGWAIPAATDIAFAVGVLALLGSRIPSSLKIFLLALAIIDDLGAIVIIALFYTADLSLPALWLAGAGIAVLLALNRSGVSNTAPYVLVGIFIWVCVLKSGVHATLAGVVTALAIPLYAKGGRDPDDGPLQRLEEQLHPWVTYAILPLFAFANAGVALSGLTLDQVMGSIPLGIAAGLFIGKPIGILAFTWLALRSGIAERPEGTNWTSLLGVAWLGGIGFTMSLFIGGLAFPDPSFAADIRIGVLGGSIASALAGYVLLRLAFAGNKPAAAAA